MFIRLFWDYVTISGKLKYDSYFYSKSRTIRESVSYVYPDYIYIYGFLCISFELKKSFFVKKKDDS